MFKITNSKRIRYKLALIMAIGLGGLVVTLALFYSGLKQGLTTEQINQTQYITELGITQIRHFKDRAVNGELSIKDAKQTVLNLLESESYGDQGYYWVVNTDGRVLIHPFDKSIVNVNVLEKKDYPKKALFIDAINTAQAGGGIIEYFWPKPNSTDSYPKSSYVLLFKEWNWVLGTGVYMDEVDKRSAESTQQAITYIVIFAFVFVIAALLLILSLVKQLKLTSIKDPLSTLYTRRFLDEIQEELLKRIERDKALELAVVYLDVDHFKKINDQYGHAKGDEVIRFIGKTMNDLSRPDDICIRYGGEEFLLIAISENRQSATTLINRIREKITLKCFETNKTSFSITLSAGIAVHRNDESLDETIKRADSHLYTAKETGRDKVVSD